jgi:hypothetical protein
MRIWVVGDSGTGGKDQAMVHDAMRAYVARTNRTIDHYIHVGDMALNGIMLNKHGATRDIFSIVKQGKVTPTRVANPWQPKHDISLLTSIRLEFGETAIGATPEGWTIVQGAGATMAVVAGGDGKQKIVRTQSKAEPLIATYTPWKLKTFDYGASIRLPAGKDVKAGLVFGYVNAKNYHRILLDAAAGVIRISRLTNGAETTISERKAAIVVGSWLNLEIEVEGGEVEVQYQSLGDWNSAVSDFNAALALDPRSRAAMIGCIEALLHQGGWREAEFLAHQGLALDQRAATQAPFRAMLARIGVRRENWPEALVAWRAALQSPQPEIDWFLGEAECLEQMGRWSERSTALRAAMQRNPSVVLRRAWIRALVDAGELAQASREIEYEITQARWQSSWLLLRARVNEMRQDPAGRRADATRALLEIRGRLNLKHPDPTLVKEEAEALQLIDPAGSQPTASSERSQRS